WSAHVCSSDPYVTSENGDYVRIYPMQVWSEIEEKLARLSSHNRTKQKFLTRANYFGQVVEMDGQGRVLIPPVLREAAQMKGEVGRASCREGVERAESGEVAEEKKRA